MDDDLKNILSDLNKDTRQDELLGYLNRDMSAEEQYAFEKQMNDDEFVNDAMEGLQTLNNKDNIPALLQQMNTDLKKQLEKKKRRRQKRKLTEQPWVYYTTALLLLLIVIAYIIIKKMAG